MGKHKNLSADTIWSAICTCKKKAEGASYEQVEHELENICTKEYSKDGMFGCISRKDIVSKILVRVAISICSKKQLEEFVVSLCKTENSRDFYTELEHRIIDFISGLDMAYPSGERHKGKQVYEIL